jgi:hypothetical protein
MAFDRAVEAVAAASAELLAELQTTAPAKDRETERARPRPEPRSVSPPSPDE